MRYCFITEKMQGSQISIIYHNCRDIRMLCYMKYIQNLEGGTGLWAHEII